MFKCSLVRQLKNIFLVNVAVLVAALFFVFIYKNSGVDSFFTIYLLSFLAVNMLFAYKYFGKSQLRSITLVEEGIKMEVLNPFFKEESQFYAYKDVSFELDEVKKVYILQTPDNYLVIDTFLSGWSNAGLEEVKQALFERSKM